MSFCLECRQLWPTLSQHNDLYVIVPVGSDWLLGCCKLHQKLEPVGIGKHYVSAKHPASMFALHLFSNPVQYIQAFLSAPTVPLTCSSRRWQPSQQHVPFCDGIRVHRPWQLYYRPSSVQCLICETLFKCRDILHDSYHMIQQLQHPTVRAPLRWSTAYYREHLLSCW